MNIECTAVDTTGESSVPKAMACATFYTHEGSAGRYYELLGKVGTETHSWTRQDKHLADSPAMLLSANMDGGLWSLSFCGIGSEVDVYDGASVKAYKVRETSDGIDDLLARLVVKDSHA